MQSFERWKLRPQPRALPCLQRLGALPSDPRASGGWGRCPQTPKLAPPLEISGYAPDEHYTLLVKITQSNTIPAARY